MPRPLRAAPGFGVSLLNVKYTLMDAVTSFQRSRLRLVSIWMRWRPQWLKLAYYWTLESNPVFGPSYE